MSLGDASHWQLLGLDPATTTIREVKRAYASLLKQNRPDTNPEDFRRIHEAYTAALQELEAGHPADDARPAVIPVSDLPMPNQPSAEAGGAPNLPEPFLTAAAKLRATPDLKSAPATLAEWRAACGDDASLWKARSRTLCEIFDTNPFALGGIAAIIPDSDILSELRAGAAESSLRILDEWYRLGFLENMVRVGQALTATGTADACHHPAGGLFALRLAFYLAIPQPGGANMLVDAAFRWLAIEVRGVALPLVENRLRAGSIFWHVRPAWYCFWTGFLDKLDAGSKPDWTLAESRRALDDLLLVTPADWPGWHFLATLLPADFWLRVSRHFRKRPVNRWSWSPAPRTGWMEHPAHEASIAFSRPGTGPQQKRRPVWVLIPAVLLYIAAAVLLLKILLWFQP